VVASFVGVGASDEPVAAEVVVVAVGVEQMPADDEDGVADGDGGFAVSHPASKPPVLSGKVGVATLAGGGGALGKDLAEPTAAAGRAPGSLLASGDVGAGADSSP
jgi:hypothetical protein